MKKNIEKIPAPDVFTGEFFHTLKKETRPILYQNKENKVNCGIFFFSSCNIIITLLLKPNNTATLKK